MSQYIAESSRALHSLVTQALVDTQKYYCPFLERGFCREQSRCNFSHDCHLSTRIPTDYCHFYLANQCLYGQDCKFLHTEPELVAHEFFVDPIDPDAATGSAYIATHYSDYEDDEDDNNDAQTTREDLKEEDEEEPNSRVNKLNGLLRLGKHSQILDGPMYESGSSSNNTINNNNNNDSHGRGDTNSAELNQQHDSIPALSSRLKATRISHRCAMVAPSSSSASSSSSSSLATATLLAKLHHLSPHSSDADTAAQISSNKNSKSNTINTTTITSTASTSSMSSAPAKGAWQNTRLIASLRNNLAESSGGASSASNDGGNSSGNITTQTEADLPLCPYSLTNGECPFPEDRCNYLHGLICDLCYSACLHPFNEKQRLQHREECLREHEREMELSFAVQRSKDKVCGICMDTVVEKKPITSSRFGILEKCNHIFCLDCIRKWRGTKQFDSRTIRACPECRVSSDFVVPSKYWVEDQDDKDKLITDYKSALRAKPCRYFKEGKGECPFAGSCFYRHAYPDGSLAVLDAPKPKRRLYGARGPTTSVANYILWNILTSTEDDDLSINDDLQSLYDLDEMYQGHESDSEDDFIGWN